MRFEWDPRKASANLRKHGISFREAATVLGDPLAWTFPDADHSESEERQITKEPRNSAIGSWLRTHTAAAQSESSVPWGDTPREAIP